MNYERALRTALDAAMEAGELLRREFHRWGGPKGFHGHADVDTEAEWLIRKRLQAVFPEFRYRGEETGTEAGRVPGSGVMDPHVWLVDPNDGTSAFLRGARGSAVSIGLVRNGVPVLGVVYSFVAPDDNGDLIYWAEGFELTRNGVPVRQQRLASGSRQAVLLLSLHRESTTGTLLDTVQPFRYRAIPSIAYRLALAAAGDGVAAVSWHGPGDWDYAGGHALIRGSGGLLVNEEGAEITYAEDGASRCRCCFGGDPAVVKDLWRRDWRRVLKAQTQEAGPPANSYFPLSRPRPGKAIASPGLLSRAEGCLLGQCCGDALGQQVEFQSAEVIRKMKPEGVRVMEDGGTWNTIAGQPTDDSELALLLARSIANHGTYEREQVARAYYYWYDRSRPFDIGNTIRRALNGVTKQELSEGRVAEGMSRAADPNSQANGSLMRISPLAVFGYRKREDELWRWAEQESALTHPHIVCRQACALFVCSAARAIRTGEPASRIYDFALRLAETCSVEASLRDALAEARNYPPSATEHAGWVLVAFQNAFHQLLKARSFEDGVVNSIMLGGDTDTNAAIAGALLGAVHGRSAVPFAWRQAVLSCRPDPAVRAEHPRPHCFWPVDLPILSELLLTWG